MSYYNLFSFLFVHVKRYWYQFSAALTAMVIYSIASGGVLVFLFYKVFSPIMRGELNSLTFSLPNTVPFYGGSSFVIYKGSPFYILTYTTVFVLMLLVVRAGAQFIRSYLSKWLCLRVEADIRKKLYLNLLNIKKQEQEQYTTGDVISRFTSDLNKIGQTISLGMRDLLQGPIEIVVAIVIAIFVAPVWSLTFLIIPAVGYFIVRMGRYLKKRALTVQESFAKLTEHLRETIDTLPVIRSYNAKQDSLKKLVSKNENYIRRQEKRLLVQKIIRPVVHLSLFLVALIVVFGGYFAVNNGMATPEQLTTLLGLIVWVYGPLRRLAKVNEKIQNGLASYKRIKPFIETKQTNNKAKSVSNRASDVILSINNISFSYPGSQEKVLNDINIDIFKNELHTLVGSNGSGKSTLLSLVLGEYKPDTGSIKTRFRPNKQVIGYVAQNTMLFGRSIKDNITLGTAFKEERIWSVLDRVGLKADIKERGGLSTRLSQAAQDLSGGQKQRLALARSILFDPPLYILDEPNDSIDPESADTIRTVLNSLATNNSSILAATHDIKLVKKADCVTYLKNGTIMQSGSHKKITKKSNLYRKLFSISSVIKNG